MNRLLLLSLMCGSMLPGEPALPADLPVGGLAVAIGIDDVPLLGELSAQGQRPVHVLVEPGKVERLRAELRKAGRLGPIQIEGWSTAVLPFADRLARLVVCADAAVKPEESLRITAPLGVRLTRAGGGWRSEAAPMSADMDEWTHPWHDAGRSRLSADRICGPAQALQWQAGPLYRQAVTVAGSGCVIALEFPAKDATDLVVRDAASGVLRWRSRIALAGSRHAPQGFQNAWFNGDGTGGLIESLTIAGDRLFVAAQSKPLVLSLKDGAKLGELATSSPVRRLPVQANRVLAAAKSRLECFDAVTFAPAWSREGMANDLCLSPGGLALFIDSSKTPSDLVAVQVADGSDAWRVGMEPYWDAAAPVKKGKNGYIEPQVRIALVTADLLVLRGSRGGGEIIVLDPVSGKERWHAGHVPFPIKQERGPDKPVEGAIPSINQIVLGGGRLWYSAGEQPPARIALDPMTGNRIGHMRYTGVNDFCQWALGSPRLVSFKDCIWLDAVAIAGVLKADGGTTWKSDGTLTADGYSTGNGRCGWQPIIAYGQNYFGPKDCNCSTNGAALRAAIERAQIAPAQQDDGRLGMVEAGGGKPGPDLIGWNQFGADARRSFAVKGNLHRIGAGTLEDHPAAGRTQRMDPMDLRR